MKTSIFILLLITSLFILTSCSSTKQSTELNTDKTDSLYVFDNVPVDSTKNENLVVIPKLSNVKLYIVQIGAFTTKEKANDFANKSRSKINNKLDIEYSKSVNLYVVQLKPFYNKKKDAEAVRNKLWEMDDFKDAWILTVIR